MLCALLILTAACTDGVRISDPLPDGTTRHVAFSLATSFQPAATAAATGEISAARVTILNAETGEVIEGVQLDLDPEAEAWSLDLEVEIPLEKDFRVILVIELLSFPDGVEQVEWSGRTDPLKVNPGEQPTEVRQVEMVRGPPANLEVDQVDFDSPPSALFVGDEVQLAARVTGGGEGVEVFFTSLDPTLAEVSVGGVLAALEPGAARIVVEAGPSADTVTVDIDAFPLPPEDELARIGPGVNDIRIRLASGLQDSGAATRLQELMLDVQEATSAREGHLIVDAIEAARTVVAEYGDGSEALLREDGPALSLITLTLDYASSVVESER